MNPPPKASNQSVWSLVLGILSITCLWILGSIPAIILGAIGMKKAKENPAEVGGGGMALAGLICGCVGILAGLVPVAMVASITIPAYSGVQHRVTLAKDIVQIRTLNFGLRAYAADNNGAFPASLEELFPDYIDAMEMKEFITPPFEGKESGILYRPGLTDTSSPTEPILLSVHPRGTKYAVCYVGGEVKEIRSEEYDQIRALFP